ncbi:MAG: 3-dehydroquinate dehydratase [Saprospiraceae bacterium]|nr:3-dehydroquinate dehydratase [Saprospiraceae bacterium]
MKKEIYIINGPNLNLLGKREPEIYGTQSFEAYFSELQLHFEKQTTLHYFQSNHEGALIDKLQEIGFSEQNGIILNAGGYTHTSIALADCISAITSPVIEVHISDIKKRESFRHHSYLEDVCYASIMGQGLKGYQMAIDVLLLA